MESVTADDLFGIIGRLYVSNVRAGEALAASVTRERRTEAELSRLRDITPVQQDEADITETVSGFSD